jgi:Rha family phage regulatory protein
VDRTGALGGLVDVARLMTDMVCVAHTFGKRHKNVLRAYDNLECSPEFSRLNFEPREYTDARRKLYRVINMTKDGFMLLVMGFKGEVAMAIKEAYIAAFNAMADCMTMHQQSQWQHMQALIAQDSGSKVRASFG